MCKYKESDRQTLAFQTLGDADHFADTSDVSSMSSVRDAMKQILDKYQAPPDAVVNSAGITMDGFLVQLRKPSLQFIRQSTFQKSFIFLDSS